MIVSSAEVEISWVYRPSEVVVVLFVLKLHGARVGERGSVHGDGVGALFVRALRQMEERRRRRIRGPKISRKWRRRTSAPLATPSGDPPQHASVTVPHQA